MFFRFFFLFPFSSVFSRFVFRKKRGDTVRETPFAKPRSLSFKTMKGETQTGLHEFVGSDAVCELAHEAHVFQIGLQARVLTKSPSLRYASSWGNAGRKMRP